MEMSNFRPESHVAQQSRRDKLRVQQALHFHDYTNNIEHISVHPVLSPDLMQVRNVRNSANSLYDPAVITSQMLNYSESSNLLFPHKNQESGAVEVDRPMAAVDASLANLSHPISSHFNSKATRNNAQHCGIWRSIGSQQQYDWNSNHASGSAAGNESNPNRIVVDEVPSTIYLKHSNGYQDVQSSLTNHASSEISSDQESQRHYEEMHVGSSSQLYHNSLQEVVTSAAILQDGIGETARRSWADGGNELVLLPQFGNQYNAIRLNNASAWMNRPTEGSHHWNSESVSTQGLSLSLSSKPPLAETRVDQFIERYGDEASHVPQDLKPTIAIKGYGNSLQDIVGTSTTTAHRHTGPLGPFTGYATILKSSRFLRPAQLLLDEICRSEIISGEVSGAKDGNSALSSSTFHSSNEISEVGVGSSSSEPHRPEYHQKKAKLLCMHEEVCRRYKQYHQQMQMVVSSFETVAGLSASTPYISFALKTVARHFRHLKNAISNQLGDIRKSSGEDLSSPTTGTSCSKGDISTSKLKYVEQGFQKHKYGGGNMGFIDPQQHVWRPQRGLPERAVSILRAWLFEHFLHPYPTDTDKHMLANQTGLTRNQVSNWFINARVRVWKPMVEEIHMLETKGSTETELNSGKNDETTATEGSNQTNCDQYFNKFSISASRDKQLECSDIGSSLGTGDAMGAEQWNQEKRSRVEGHNPAGMDGSLMGFVPYHRNGLEIGGLGSVSLTLGLRQSAESAQQQQLQQQEHQLRQHFGGHILHDFVG